MELGMPPSGGSHPSTLPARIAWVFCGRFSGCEKFDK
jgi:hypothetical protein